MATASIKPVEFSRRKRWSLLPIPRNFRNKFAKVCLLGECRSNCVHRTLAAPEAPAVRLLRMARLLQRGAEDVAARAVVAALLQQFQAFRFPPGIFRRCGA